MQRYSTASCSSGVSNGTVGGSSSRDTSRADSTVPSSNYIPNPRRPTQLIPYKLKCDKERINSRLGPPDFCPQTPNCPEETLTREYVQSGYKDTIEGLEDAKEISLSHLGTFTKPVVLKCKEAIKKHLRAINESRAQKRKAGQVYGVPLSGSLLIKSGIFPEKRPYNEEFRKKWIESLSQQHKRLRSLADHTPHGYRKRTLFEVLIRNNVPLLRATWFIKVTYLNQVQPASTSVSSGVPDKTQLARTEQWTKDVIDYLKYLLDEFSRGGSHPTLHGRDQSPQMLFAGTVQHKVDPATTFSGKDPSLNFKWWYMVRLIQWHHAEGLLLPSNIIDWVLDQLQETDSLETFQLLLPIIFGVIETVALSQTCVRSLVEVAVHFIREPSPGGSDLVDNSRRVYTNSVLVEMLRYLIVAVPDTFVALDCFPLPPCVVFDSATGKSYLTRAPEDAEKIKHGLRELASGHRGKWQEVHHQNFSLNYFVSSIHKCVDTLATAVSHGYHGQGLGVAKAVLALDEALMLGDVRGAYNFIFEEFCYGGVEEGWFAGVSPFLRSSLKWVRTVSFSFVCSVFFLCEWATCDFRDCRTTLLPTMKFTGRNDFSQVYAAVLLLKLKIEDLNYSHQFKKGSALGARSIAKGASQNGDDSGDNAVENVFISRNKSKCVGGNIDGSDIFQSPGPVHDILVCWIDQHEASKGEGFKRLQLLIMELIHAGIFYPQAYVRQLIVSGIMDRNETLADFERRKRHYRILKHLPGSYICDALQETQIAEASLLLEAVHVYSNERHLLLHGLKNVQYKNEIVADIASQKKKDCLVSGRDGASPASYDQWKNHQLASSSRPDRNARTKAQVAELKASISILLHLPNSYAASADTGPDESQGNAKRVNGSICNKMDVIDGTVGCEEHRRAKRQKSNEERSSLLQWSTPNPSDDEDTWWVRKGPKSLDSFKVNPPLKPTKHVSRGRQKIVRKTQSLAHLAAARIEGSQGASTSHICDNRISCPHNTSGMDGEVPKLMNGIRTTLLGDIVSLGKSLKHLRFIERRSITAWLITLVRHLIDETENTAGMVGQFSEPFPHTDDRGSVQWRLGEDELSAILYLMDVSSDLVSAARFLLWLFPKVLTNPNSAVHGGRRIPMLPKNMESHACVVGEAFLLSSICRYENILTANDLIPQALLASMQRAAAVMASNGRPSGSATFIYARNLLKKYGSVDSVAKWEKIFKSTCDQRLLSELESGQSLDSKIGFSLGVPAGVEDLDDYFRQRISGRLSRVGSSMKEIVQRQVEEAVHYFYGKGRKLFAAGTLKVPAIERWDDEDQIAQKIFLGLMDCMRQSAGAAQEGDPSLVASAVSAVVSNVGPAIMKRPDFTPNSNYPSVPSTTDSLNCARRILHVHIRCLCLLKEAIGERLSRVFEIALATEASSVLAGALAPVKAPRSQFQLSPEANDSSTNLSNEMFNNSAKVHHGRAKKIGAAVSALIIGAVIHGVTSLERMITVFRLKEGLDALQFIRSVRSNSNGISRSTGSFKVDNSIEVYVHWFRLLVGNCRTVSDGLIVELLGELYILAFSRTQQMLPLRLVLPPAYSIFALLIWRPYIHNEDIHQLYQSLTLAISDAIRHLPFRNVCLRDTRAFYDFVASDVGDSEFAAMLEIHGPDKQLKPMTFVPLRARLFLNSILDCRMPHSVLSLDEGNWVPGHGESKVYQENETKLVDQIVHVLDNLQPAKFHWQWLELRLLLNEQTLIEKIGTHNMSTVEAIRSLSTTGDNSSLSDNENIFTDIILTRLLVRPDAASLYSEVMHLFGMSQKESLLAHTRWFLGGQDVLFGRKSVRQRLVSIAHLRGVSTKLQFWKPWGWSNSSIDVAASKEDRRKFEANSLEEGEVVEESTEVKKYGRGEFQIIDVEGLSSRQQYVTERALVELVLHCIDQSSSESCNTFANDLIKQMNNIEQQINSLTRGASRQAGTIASGIEGAANKGNTRKGIRGGSPGLSRRSTGATDVTPSSSVALRASMWLRLQFLLRLLPIICADREPSGRNMRHMLATVILRLLGSRVVYEDASIISYPIQRSTPKRDGELLGEASVASPLDLPGDNLFDWLLLVLHGLLGSCQPSWLKPKSASKSTVKSSRGFSAFDHEVAESLQNDLDHMQLPEMIRWRLQAAMPKLPPYPPCFISCHPPALSTTALASLQSSILLPGLQIVNLNSQRSLVPSTRTAANMPGKSKSLSSQDQDMEVDPWTLLEDGTGSSPSPGNSGVVVAGDHANLRACSWLKGAVRVRRTDLTYVGTMDDDN